MQNVDTFIYLQFLNKHKSEFVTVMLEDKYLLKWDDHAIKTFNWHLCHEYSFSVSELSPNKTWGNVEKARFK